MARTRTSDQTSSREHAKPLVYACLLAAGVTWSTGRLWASGQGGEGFVPCVTCQVLSVTPDEAQHLPPSLPGVRVAVRTAASTSDQRATGWQAALTELGRRGTSSALHLVGVPDEDDPLLAAAVDLFIVEPAIPAETAANPAGHTVLAFDLKRALAAARGRHPAATLLVAVPAAVAQALRANGLTPYADGFIDPPAAIETAADLLAPAEPDRTRVRIVPSDAQIAAGIFRAAVPAAAWFPGGLVPAAGRYLRCGEDRRIRAFLNPQTLDLVGTTRACPAPAVVTSGGVSAERLDMDGVSAFRVREASGDRFAEGVTVGAARTLTAAEIVARHQAAAARQAAGVRSDVASGTLTLAFEAPGFVAPVTITAATTIFRDATRTDLRQADIRVNGVSFTPKDGVPRLPIIEPERVAAVPLAITLTDVYRYELEGRDT